MRLAEGPAEGGFTTRRVVQQVGSVPDRWLAGAATISISSHEDGEKSNLIVVCTPSSSFIIHSAFGVPYTVNIEFRISRTFQIAHWVVWNKQWNLYGLYRCTLESALSVHGPTPTVRAHECQQYARYAVHTHDTTLSQHALLSSIRPCGAAPTAGPARGSTGIPASASSTGRTRTGGRTARRGASSGWRSTRCTWSRLRCSTRERRGGR